MCVLLRNVPQIVHRPLFKKGWTGALLYVIYVIGLNPTSMQFEKNYMLLQGFGWLFNVPFGNDFTVTREGLHNVGLFYRGRSPYR